MKRSFLSLAVVALMLSCLGLLDQTGARAAGASRPLRLPWSGYLAAPAEPHVVLVNVRATPSLASPVVARTAIGTPVTVYGVATGDAVLTGNPLWYRLSPATKPARYVYSEYVLSDGQVIPTRGKLILVSLASQWLIAFQDGHRVLDTPVTTGRPQLPTPTGTFKVLAKFTPYKFISPWPVGSSYYYPPSMTHYALQFRADGYFIHDAPWRSAFGPGTNLPHADPGDPLGSHGCVNVPLSAQQTLFAWAAVGTPVRIIR